MRVLHILAELKFSGAEIMYVAAAKTFQQLGCELFVVNTSINMGEYAQYFCDSGYKVLHWPYENLSFIEKMKYWNKVACFIQVNKIDVVHVHRHDMKCVMAYSAWSAGAKCIYTFHNVFSSSKVMYIYHYGLRWVAKNIFHQVQQSISDSVYERELKHWHNKTIKINNWYDSKRFSPALEGEKTKSRRELNISSDALVLISIGGCSYIKRHHDIIEALPILLKHFPNIIYLHLGVGNTLEEEKALAEKMKLSSYVWFLGNQTEVRKYLVASDIYLMTSRHEGIPITTIEAMACGIPSVLYDVPGLRDFNKVAECSILIKENSKVLAESILSLANNKKKKEEISNNGRAFVLKNYDMVTNVKKIFDLYQNC